MSSEGQHNPTGKCLCPYCSGSIARGMQAWNDENVQQCQAFVEKYASGVEKNFQNLDSPLSSLNPVQCLDILDQLCRHSSATETHPELDALIVKYLERFRANGGFFLCLKEPPERRVSLLQRLERTILTDAEYQERLRLNVNDLH